MHCAFLDVYAAWADIGGAGWNAASCPTCCIPRNSVMTTLRIASKICSACVRADRASDPREDDPRYARGDDRQ